jgi:hypothetical protein
LEKEYLNTRTPVRVIAHKYGLKRQQVNYLLRRYNIPTRERYWRKKAVKCVETGECFPTMLAAGKKVGCGASCISQAVQFGCRAKGFYWVNITETEYKDYKEEKGNE